MAEGFAVLSRRRFLRWTLGAGAAVVAGGAGLAALRGRAPSVAGLQVLGAHEYRTLARLAEALYPLAAADELDMARAFDRVGDVAAADALRDLLRALFLLGPGPVLFERRLSTFSHLTREERVAHFEAWAASDSLLRRQVSVAFRRFLAITYYDRPAAWSRIGYDGPLPVVAKGG